ncbi:MAG: hypothetical protein J6125_00775 [Clostridia bacterium]|nr:hypothetical protein [Clostridia bacterium]
MQKTVIVINGCGGVGKDTLVEMAARHLRVRNVSSITPIKEIARLCGWDGAKDDRSRKFLADLKQLTVDYNDYPTRWLTEQYRAFLSGEDEVMFVHIREPREIEKFVAATGGRAVTLLIRGGKRFLAERGGAGYGNAADDEVENYPYDYIYVNNRPLRFTRAAFLRFLDRLLIERAGTGSPAADAPSESDR